MMEYYTAMKMNEAALYKFMLHDLYQWFSKYGSWTSSISIIWELVGNAHFQAHPRSNESQSGVSPSWLCFSKMAQFWCMLHVENCWFTICYEM